MSVNTETLVVSDAIRSARSETRNQFFSARSRARSETPGMVIEGGVSSDGDWVGPPPGRSAKSSSARNCAVPAAMMLIATPETMWSTPNTTVATACSMPPSAPRAAAPMRPAQIP